MPEGADIVARIASGMCAAPARARPPERALLVRNIQQVRQPRRCAGDCRFSRQGEIKFLYVDPEFKRRGIGRQLPARLATQLEASRYPGAALSVVKGNAYADVDVGRVALAIVVRRNDRQMDARVASG
nr:GNAT family N-acetyltransferase [Burkholderia ubonensis]